MSAPKVLLHLGLPKTATSSLQHNVLQKLHEENRINFLGKCLDYDYRTAKLEVFNYSGQFIRDAAEEKMSIEDARKQLAIALKPDRLNVFSDEGIMVAYPGKENLPLSRKFENLRVVFKGYDVRVVVTLRQPIDYLYSLYVQLYPDFCSKVHELNSVQKYADRLISDQNNVLFESFFYTRWLSELKDRFQVTKFQYEDISNRLSSAYQGWANLLGIPVDEFKSLFDDKVLNRKERTAGDGVKRVGDLKIVENRFRIIFSYNRLIYNFSKVLYRKTGLKALLNYRFAYGGTHRYPEGEQYEKLKKVLLK